MNEKRENFFHAMDIDTAALRSLHIIGSEGIAPTWLESRLQAELPQILPQLLAGAPVSGCPLADIGEYLLRLLQIVSQFAHNIAFGKFVREYATSRLESLLDDDDGTATDYLHGKHEALK